MPSKQHIPYQKVNDNHIMLLPIYRMTPPVTATGKVRCKQPNPYLVEILFMQLEYPMPRSRWSNLVYAKAHPKNFIYR